MQEDNHFKVLELGPPRFKNIPRGALPKLPSTLPPPMDSPIIARLFKQLFSHQRCQALRSQTTLSSHVQDARRIQRRCVSTGSEKRRSDANWQQRTDILPFDMKEEFDTYPMLTANQLRTRKERPKRVKMLTRDFIEGLFYKR
jgi:hypothetical protein